ncbi:polyhydroxyalkanoic acid system family protein [Ferrimonas lipolytica]|uniref:Polyhydroxyalkanoic acid system protein n=1 Tax=Ferrimonas lipolytica TaxID=2724191 RepID=A0A6H1UAD0_9GAMM|nr:polyhydroxyalkanoic acid system family protein [Ferrimonas lipolytica]QIZ75540.1 hypothetical protein HER31_00640 [Ferrimonas lipolytica]
MASIYIERLHQLEPQQLQTMVRDVAENLEQEYQLRFKFDGDDIQFRRSGARGELRALSDKVIISMELSMLFRPLAGSIHRAIEQRLDQLLD